MYISEPFIRFESPAAFPSCAPAGVRSLVAVIAAALVLFVAMLAVTPAITRLCPAPRAGTPVHLAR